MGRLVVCADDFALTAGVSRTIADLALGGKLNAISCMALSPRWSDDARLLDCIVGPVEIGIHLVLTDEPAFGTSTKERLPSASQLSRMALFRRLAKAEIAAAIAVQFDRFEEVMGRPPAFVDGHQHCHLLRGIRNLVIAETARRAPDAWLRTCEDRAFFSRPFPLKALANSVGSAGFTAAARRAGLRCNSSFSGLYDFGDSFGEIFPRFLMNGGDFHLVICHPGSGDCAEDSISAARVREAAALRALPLVRLAEQHGLTFQTLRQSGRVH